MSSTDDEDYGDIPDEDLIEALSQPSQHLPELPQRHKSRDATDSGDEETKLKKKKYRIHNGVDKVPAAQILGATQADRLPDSSPYRIRGPIYRKPREEPPKPTPTPKRSIFSPAASRRAPQPKPTQSDLSFTRTNSLSDDEAFARALQDLPDDAFLSSPDNDLNTNGETLIGSSPPRQTAGSSFSRQRLAAPQLGLRQTTLFGGRAPEEVSASQAKKVYNFKVDKIPELPTHHVLNHDTLDTWIYPTNLGKIRDYQFSIVRNGLFNNLLVALPTGLGKTFIAATIMYNFFRWTKDAQIVFVAPTKPLVAQQVDACFTIVGLPRSETTMLTGDQPPALRAEEWSEKRVFFMTPQTLMNDLATGIADPKKIVLLVVDEAHRATGEYAYVKVVQFMRRFSKSFRILALTATPGSTVEGVQAVIDGLEISKVEIRTEESIDISRFVHRRDIDQVLLDPSDEIIMIKELLSKALQPLAQKLCGQNAYYNKDPMTFTTFGMIQARTAWFASDAGRKSNQGVKGMVHALFAVAASVAHSIKLLNYHGIGPFYESIKDFRSGADGDKGGKHRKAVIEHPDFMKIMNIIQSWINKEDFIGHPKLTYLCDTVLNHFLDAGEGRLAEGAPPSSTRVIVFSEYRDSAEEIVRVLNRHGPMVRASVFVGQQDSKRSEGMNQVKQQQTIEHFKKGIFNVLVATSIGEEGLDIGQVDLIVCYDASGSPIRMLQRMGRTGRKRAGNIVLLLMRGKEEQSFSKAKDNYEQIQKMISDGARFTFRHDLSARIIPKEITPVVDKRLLEIPPENTQDNSLPEPKRRASKLKKRPAKKFHMPDGVETGFQKASRVTEDGVVLIDLGITVKPKVAAKPKIELEPIPEVEKVLLNAREELELEKRYQSIAGSELQEVSMPDMTSQTSFQRLLLPTVQVLHGSYTKRCVGLFNTLANFQQPESIFDKPYGEEQSLESWAVPQLMEDEREAYKPAARFDKKVPAKRAIPEKRVMDVLSESGGEVEHAPPAKRQQIRQRATQMDLISSEGEGDDLADSEQPSEDDDDDGGSLVDFLASEDRPSSLRTIPSSQVATPSSPIPQKQRPFYEAPHFTATQDTVDDLPDIEELLGVNTQTKSRNPVVDIDDIDNEDNDELSIHRRAKRRHVVEDDSDD